MEYVKYFPPVTADKPHVTHLPKLIFCLLETPRIDIPIWVIGEAHTKCGWREEVGRYCIFGVYFVLLVPGAALRFGVNVQVK